MPANDPLEISAMPGGIGEEILKAIAENSPIYNKRLFNSWEGNYCHGVVRFDREKKKGEIVITLKIGERRGLFIEEVPFGKRFSIRRKGDSMVIKVGQRLPPDRISDAANEVVAVAAWCSVNS